MSKYFRHTGEVHPLIPASAPLGYRLDQEVYALDGCVTGPEIHPPGRPHFHHVRCSTSYDMGHRHSLGQFSPEEARRGRLINEIIRLQKIGKTQAEIRAYLLQPSGLPRLHPCADLNGENLCSPTEIDERLIEAPLIEKKREEKKREEEKQRKEMMSTLLRPRNLLIAGGLAGLLWFMYSRRS